MNEVIWRDFWTAFKVWDNVRLLIVSTPIQLWLMQRHALPKEEETKE